MTTAIQHDSKQNILMAALHVIRAKGYAATTVDDVCREAGLTKGSFFHHFKSKEEMTLGAVEFWNTGTEAFFGAAPYHQETDPLKRLLGYLEFRKQIVQGELADYTCLIGTLVQETYDTHPEFRSACESGLQSHIDCLTRDVTEAKAKYCPDATWRPESIGALIQSALQGSFILAKAAQDPTVIRESLGHLKRYLNLLFGQPANAS